MPDAMGVVKNSVMPRFENYVVNDFKNHNRRYNYQNIWIKFNSNDIKSI